MALGDERPWLKYDNAEDAFKMLDLDGDEKLIYEEVYEIVQQDKILRRIFNSMFDEIDKDGKGGITRDEVLEYVVRNNKDASKTLEELQAEADGKFDAWNTDGGDSIKKLELMFAVYPEIRKTQALKREHEDEYFNSREGWADIDKDHDNLVSAYEM